MSGNDWSDSLFKDEKGDSLGDGTWGKREETKLAPVAWDKLPDAPDPSKKVRARLATPAPGSQKESGLLDIKSLAPSLAAGMRDKKSVPATPTPAPNEPARLATSAKGSAGSGLIDVQELARMQKKANAKAADSVAEAALEAMNSSSGMHRDALAASGSHTAVAPDTDAEVEAPSGGGQSKLFMVIALLAIAFVGMAIYVLTSM